MTTVLIFTDEFISAAVLKFSSKRAKLVVVRKRKRDLF